MQKPQQKNRESLYKIDPSHEVVGKREFRAENKDGPWGGVDAGVSSKRA